MFAHATILTAWLPGVNGHAQGFGGKVAAKWKELRTFRSGNEN